MPRKKKKSTATKKKEVVRPARVVITEWEDWKAGDLAWGKTFALNKSIYGEIVEFHPNDNHGPAVTLFTPDGRFITVLVSTLSEKAHKKKKQRALRRKSSK